MKPAICAGYRLWQGIFTPASPCTCLFSYYNVVLFSKFLTMTATSCRYIEKLLSKHLVFPEAQRWLSYHSTTDLIRNLILSWVSSWIEIHLLLATSKNQSLLTPNLHGKKPWPRVTRKCQYEGFWRCFIPFGGISYRYYLVSSNITI